NYCWTEIREVIDNDVDMRDPQFLRMIHCLRFIREAFRARVDCLEDFRRDLADFIINILQQENQNILLQKIAVEAVGVLRDEDIDVAITQAIAIGDPWINETALRACRHLPRISDDLRKAIIDYIDSFGFRVLFQKKDDLLFSFKLSDGFNEVRRFLQWRIMDAYTFVIGFTICFVINPLSPFMTILLIFTFYLWFKVTFYLSIKFSWEFINIGFKKLYLYLLIKLISENINIKIKKLYFYLLTKSPLKNKTITVIKISLPTARAILVNTTIAAQMLTIPAYISITSENIYYYSLWTYLEPLYYFGILLLFPIYYIPFYFVPLTKDIFQRVLDINFFIFIKKVTQVIYKTIIKLLLPLPFLVIVGTIIFIVALYYLLNFVQKYEKY
ncbi:MAG: hypothetical protein F6K21_30105, partial [Symploca sp. SIO2D2]|nr:hypothetical protein [Symploca sp. SIO2D2]